MLTEFQDHPTSGVGPASLDHLVTELSLKSLQTEVLSEPASQLVEFCGVWRPKPCRSGSVSCESAQLGTHQRAL